MMLLWQLVVVEKLMVMIEEILVMKRLRLMIVLVLCLNLLELLTLMLMKPALGLFCKNLYCNLNGNRSNVVGRCVDLCEAT